MVLNSGPVASNVSGASSSRQQRLVLQALELWQHKMGSAAQVHRLHQGSADSSGLLLATISIRRLSCFRMPAPVCGCWVAAVC